MAMAALTIATTARAVDPAPTDAEITSSLARNPVVNGIPACAIKSTASDPASKGCVAARPR